MIPRTFTAYQAIARKAMTMSQLRAYLGCTSPQAASAVESLLRDEMVKRIALPGQARYVYEAAR
jgi:DNA-binding transcriptional regulator GbsR (MarR family)